MRKHKFVQVPVINTHNPNQLKTTRIKQHLNLQKDQLDLKDIIALVDQMKIDSSKSKDIATKLFNDLNKNKKGYIETEEFIEEIINKKKIITEEVYSSFYEKVDAILESKSNTIISKLKRIQTQEWLAKDKAAREDIQWIISSLADQSIYEIDTNEIIKHLKGPQKNGLEYLVKYSNLEDNQQKEEDYLNVRRKSKIYSTTQLRSVQSTPRNSSRHGSIEKRRSTNLSTMISPSIIAKVYDQLCKVTQFDFNIFILDELLGKRALIFTANEILSRFEIVQYDVIDDMILKNFLNKIAENYDRTQAIYHNDLHASDVMQTCFAIISNGNLQNKMKLGQLDIFALLIAAMCHDYKHPGQNNQYHINSKSKIAMRYNDQSVLENYHIAQTMKVLNQPDHNIFHRFPPEEFRTCKRRIIDSIFATDMVHHQDVVGGAKIKGESYSVIQGYNFEKIFEDTSNAGKLFDTQQCMFNMIIHTSDISNPGKPDKISEQWTKRVYDEFFSQGDLEKKHNLTVSVFCDREKTNINKAMIGFINFVVGPTIDVLTNLIPEAREMKAYYKGNLLKYQLRVKIEEKLAAKQKAAQEPNK